MHINSYFEEPDNEADDADGELLPPPLPTLFPLKSILAAPDEYGNPLFGCGGIGSSNDEAVDA